VFWTDSEDHLTPLALVVYKFDGVPDHPVLVRPHGNAKSNKAYRRTKESTKSLLRDHLQEKNPKDAVDKVHTGILKAQSAGDIPRDRNQAYNMHKKLKQQKILSSLGSSNSSLHDTRDMLYVVMEQCKSAEKSDVFVQDVTCAPEPMAILCNEQQLVDIERFCCNPFNFGILGIDPTFNLGEFSVTPIVYQHLLLKSYRTGQSPLMLGPLLVHYRKEYRSYTLSTLCALNRKLKAVKAVGTDGEKNLVDAALNNFHQAAHIRCFRHLEKNVEMHLQEQHFPASDIKEYVHDIFGWHETNGTYHEGLVDCCDSIAFDEALISLKEKWDKIELSAFNNCKSHKPQFHEWFVQWKSEDFRSCTLRSLREDLGLGSPPKAFYTNNSESINALLKECTGYKKQQWATFNDKMKEAVKQQQREVEKAIIGYGEYKLLPQYSSLSVTVEKWFHLTTEQRQRFINKFNSATVNQSFKSSNSEQSPALAIPDNEHLLVSTSAMPGHQSTSDSTINNESAMDGQDHDITTGRFATDHIATREERSLAVSL